MKRIAWIWALAAITCLAACSDSTAPQPTNSNLRGQVLNALGEPIAGADVVLQYTTDPPLGSLYDKPATSIAFDLPQFGPVDIWINSYCDDALVRVLVDGESPPGQQAVVWDGLDDDGRTVPDGVYQVHLETETATVVRPVLLLRQGYQLPDAATLAALTTTAADGRFAIAQACLPFGFNQDYYDEHGDVAGTITVTRTVVAWVYDPASGQLLSSEPVVVDVTDGAEVTITLGD